MEEKKAEKNTDLETDVEFTSASPEEAQPHIEVDEATLDESETRQKESEPQETEKEGKIDESVISVEEELERLQADVEATKDRMLRTAAEFENYKKRAEREKNEFMKYIATEFVTDLLPIMDNLERAIDAIDQGKDNASVAGQNFESFREGVKLIYKQLQDVLTRRGVTQIEAVGKPFDPNVHEAVMQTPSEEYPANTVVAEFQKGYMLHDRVIRASMVSVSSGNPEGEGGGENE
ncbi:MAG: nucleotide exchange factor GrpE [Candidatus Poribacteria bacterium]